MILNDVAGLLLQTFEDKPSDGKISGQSSDLPLELIIQHILAFVNDRSTFLNCMLTCKYMYTNLKRQHHNLRHSPKDCIILPWPTHYRITFQDIIRKVEFTPRGNQLTIAANAAGVHVLESRHGQVARLINHYDYCVWNAIYNKHCNILTISASHGPIQLWNNQNSTLYTLPEKANHAGIAAWSPSGTLLAMALANGHVQILDINNKSSSNNKNDKNNKNNNKNKNGTNNNNNNNNNNDDMSTMDHDIDNNICHTIKRDSNQYFNTIVKAIQFAPNNNHILAVARQFQVTIWDITKLFINKDGKGTTKTTTGTRIPTSRRSRIRRFSDDSYSTFDDDNNDDSNNKTVDISCKISKRTFDGPITCIKFTTHAKVLAVACSDCPNSENANITTKVQLWNTKTNTLLVTLLPTPKKSITQITDLLFDSEENVIATCDDGYIQLWHKEEKQTSSLSFHDSSNCVDYLNYSYDAIPSHISTRHRGAITSCTLSPNGQTLVTGGVDKTIQFWDYPRLLSRAKMAKSSNMICFPQCMISR